MRADRECLEQQTACDGGTLLDCQQQYHGNPDFGGYDESFWVPGQRCGDGLCVSPAPDEAFCALSNRPVPGCGNNGYSTACDSPDWVSCLDGYAQRVETCRSCDLTRALPCGGGPGDVCALDSDCVPGLGCQFVDGGVPGAIAGDHFCSIPCDASAPDAGDTCLIPTGTAVGPEGPTTARGFSELPGYACISGWCLFAAPR